TLHWSDELYRIYGLDPHEGNINYETFIAMVHPEDVTNATDAINTALADMQPFDFHHRIIRPDGTIRLLHGRGEVIVKDGKAIMMVGTGLDVTEQKQAEKQILGLLESSHDAVVIVDKNNKINLINAETGEMFGYDSKKLLGKDIFQLIPEKYWIQHSADIEKAFNKEMELYFETVGNRNDLSEFPIEVSLTSIENIDSHLISIAIRDITESKQQAKVVETQKAEIEKYTHIASHDLKEPLRMISMYSQLLLKRYGGQMGDDADKFIHSTIEGVKKMYSVIDDLIDYSSAGKEELSIEEIDCNSLMEEIKASVNSRPEYKHAEISVAHMPVIIYEKNQLKRIFYHLIENGIKFNKNRKKTVAVSATEMPAEWQFEVKDNGIGIDERYYERVFEIFQRLHKKDEFAGNGIGLAICKKIIEFNKGRI
ncbi:MAG TPA: PAS domain S-box protein, partial [Flavobacterium sp.]|nr:PAS domain S-box protein [Flavobacterium sp.]